MKSPRQSADSQNESDERSASARPLLAASAAVTYRTARRIVIVVIGGTLFLVGALFLFSPMPGAAAILVVGLGILGLEFEFARRWLETFKVKSVQAAERFRSRRRRAGGRGDEDAEYGEDDPEYGEDRENADQPESSGRSRK